jgi:hypothetical protein
MRGVPLDKLDEVQRVLSPELLEVRHALVLLQDGVDAAGAAAEDGRLLLAEDSIQAGVSARYNAVSELTSAVGG